MIGANMEHPNLRSADVSYWQSSCTTDWMREGFNEKSTKDASF